MQHTARRPTTNDGLKTSVPDKCQPSWDCLAQTSRHTSSKTARTRGTLLAAALSLAAWTSQTMAQEVSSPITEDTSGLPQMSDFTPPYTCPWFFNRPVSCDTPIKIAVECVDLRTIDPKQLTRPLTETELANAEKACELLPMWLDQDPRIIITNKDEDFRIKYRFSVSGKNFMGIRVFKQKNNFRVKKPFEDPFGSSSYFVEESLLELGERGYLP